MCNQIQIKFVDEKKKHNCITKYTDIFTGACGQDTASPLFTPCPPFAFFFRFHGLGQKKDMCVYCHMSKKSRVGRSGLIFFFIIGKNRK